MLLWLNVAELGSDEDDIDDEGQEYLEMLAKQAGEDGDDEDWEEDDAEETALEGYTTTVDDEENLVDEYQIFKAILQSKMLSCLPESLLVLTLKIKFSKMCVRLTSFNALKLAKIDSIFIFLLNNR